MQPYTSTTSRTPTTAAIVMKGAAAMPRRNDVTAKSAGLRRTLARGEALFAQGDTAENFYKVVSGMVRTYKLLSDGRRQIDEFHLAGDIFGLETGKQHRFSAEAVDDAIVIAFHRRRFEKFANEDQVLGDEVMTSAMRSLERAHDHMMLLGRKTAQEKIVTFLLDLAKRMPGDKCFKLLMLRSDIADHLGLTIETVSRTLTQLDGDGLIKITPARRSIVLQNQAALQRLIA